ncbi:hypothetical protein ERO13_A11G050301v2 [Gossypium hirsutum]|nr:hypothetical protein ERO13_A11G050301v2 [Gossypium hirsutum]
MTRLCNCKQFLLDVPQSHSFRDHLDTNYKGSCNGATIRTRLHMIHVINMLAQLTNSQRDFPSVRSCSSFKCPIVASKWKRQVLSVWEQKIAYVIGNVTKEVGVSTSTWLITQDIHVTDIQG